MARQKKLQLSLSETEHNRLKSYAQSQEKTMAEVMRDCIRGFSTATTQQEKHE
jgi:hypothetical protein